MADRFIAVHNVDLANRDAKDDKSAPPAKRIKAGTTVSEGMLTDSEREDLIARGAIRAATDEEAKAADAKEQAEKEAQRTGGLDLKRQRLAQKQAGERAKVEEKFDSQKRAELLKLEGTHAKEREDLEQKLVSDAGSEQKPVGDQKPQG